MSDLFSNNDRIARDFAEFHAAHPEVYRLFLGYARDIKGRGFDRYSADAILHRIRWWHHVEKGDRDWKINNNFSALYARKAMDEHPDLSGFFEIRVRKSA